MIFLQTYSPLYKWMPNIKIQYSSSWINWLIDCLAENHPWSTSSYSGSNSAPKTELKFLSIYIDIAHSISLSTLHICFLQGNVALPYSIYNRRLLCFFGIYVGKLPYFVISGASVGLLLASWMFRLSSSIPSISWGAMRYGMLIDSIQIGCMYHTHQYHIVI